MMCSAFLKGEDTAVQNKKVKIPKLYSKARSVSKYVLNKRSYGFLQIKFRLNNALKHFW